MPLDTRGRTLYYSDGTRINYDSDDNAIPQLRDVPPFMRGANGHGNFVYQLAKWAEEQDKPIEGHLKAALRKMGCLDEFFRETPHTLITCAFPKDMPIHVAYKKLRSVSHSWLDEAQATMEGFCPEQGHPHFHLLTLGRPKVQNIVKCFSKRFGVPANLVDVAASNSHKLYLQRRKQYLQGIKQESKMHKVRQDREYRDAHEIPHLIELFS